MEIGISAFTVKEVEAIARLGVRHSFVGSYMKDLDKVIAKMRECGITCDTLHAPFSHINDMWSEDEEKGEAELKSQMEAIDLCVKHGVPVVITHVSSGRPMPPINEAGIARYDALVAHAREKGVKIAFENLRYLENLALLMDRYPDMGFCWDTGHERCYTPDVRYMPLYGDRTIALHVHDNACGMDTDDHVLPFDGKIDFESVAADLAKYDCKCTLMLEIGRSSIMDGEALYEEMSYGEFYGRAVASAHRLSAMVEERRK